MSTLDESWWTRVLAGPDGDLRSRDSSERYVVLPRVSEPRIVVDRDHPQAMREAVERFAASRTKSRAVRSLAAGGSALLSKTKAQWSIDARESGETLRDHLCDVLDADVRLSITIGPPRPNRKPVVRCYGENGLLAVAKLGPDPHTALLVESEGRWLDAMAARPLRGVMTPPLLHSGVYGDCALVVMGALDLESDLGVDFADVPVEVARELSDRHESGQQLLDTKWWHDLRRRVDCHELASVAAQMVQAQDHPESRSLRISAWHGDWSPWNMGRSRDGKLCIWDWERATIGVPAGFDIAHLHYQYGEGLHGADQDLEKMGVPTSQHVLVKRLYLFELCARHAEADVLDTDRHRHVVAALDRLAPTHLGA